MAMTKNKPFGTCYRSRLEENLGVVKMAHVLKGKDDTCSRMNGIFHSTWFCHVDEWKEIDNLVEFYCENDSCIVRNGEFLEGKWGQVNPSVLKIMHMYWTEWNNSSFV